MDAAVMKSYLKDLLLYIDKRYISLDGKKEITLNKKGAIVDYTNRPEIKKIYKKLEKCC